MKKESILLYANQWGALARLTDGQLGCLFRNIFLWLNDHEIDLDTLEPPLQIAFQFMTLRVSIDNEKYLQKCKKNEEMRKKRKERQNVKIDSQSEEPRACAINDKDNDNDNDKDNDNKIDIIQKEEKKESKAEKIQNFIKYWNQCIDATGSRMRKVMALTPDRRNKIETIMRTFPAEDAAQAIANAMRSPYCNGETQRRPKPVDFDWLLRLDNFAKALEGAL